MIFQMKLGKCFQARAGMFNHICLQRRLNIGFQQNLEMKCLNFFFQQCFCVSQPDDVPKGLSKGSQ